MFHARPPQQKLPDDARLKAWYTSVFDSAKDLGLASEWKTFREAFAHSKSFPCLSNDYWTEIDAGKKEVSLHGDSFFVVHLCTQCARHQWPCKKCRSVSRPVRPDDDIACDVFESALSVNGFLSKNHLQFDTLKNAKYSTTVLLQFLSTGVMDDTWIVCDFCSRGVVGSGRWWCPTCPDKDLCADCADNHAHLVEPAYGTHVVRSAGSDADFMMMGHALSCGGCESQFCINMRRALAHAGGCGVLGCHECMNVASLLKMHSLLCDEERCIVPLCCRSRHGI